MEFETKTIEAFTVWIKIQNLIYFKHLKGLTGTYSPVLKLNQKRKFMPVHIVSLREGMQIRNWMRGQNELCNLNDEELSISWTELIDQSIRFNNI